MCVATETPVIKQDKPPDKCLIPMHSKEDSNTPVFEEIVQMQSKPKIVYQMRTAQHLFQNTNFNNCNFTFALRK